MSPDWDDYKTLGETLLPYWEKAVSEKWNASLLWAQPFNLVYPFTSKPIDDWFNLKGLKMRVYSAEFADFYDMLGGTGVFIAWGEVYTSIEKGVVDGYTSDIVKCESLKLYEVLTHFYDMPLETNHCVWLMSQASFEALPEDLQKIVKEEADATIAKYVTDVDELEQKNRDLIEEKGMQRVVPPPETVAKIRTMVREQLHPVWVQKLDPDGREAYQKALAIVG